MIAAKKSAHDPSRKRTRDITWIENTTNKNKEQKRVKTEHRVSTRNKTANKAANPLLKPFDQSVEYEKNVNGNGTDSSCD